MTASFGRLLNIYENIIASCSDRAATAAAVAALHGQVWAERTIFVCWGRAVGIYSGARAAKALDDPEVLLAVDLTICSVANVFSDAAEALRVYGVQIDTGQKTLLQRVLSGFGSGCAAGSEEGDGVEWQVRDGRKFGDLVEQLKRVNCDLHRIIPRGPGGSVDAAGAVGTGSDMDKATNVGLQGGGAAAASGPAPSLPPPPAYSPGSAPPPVFLNTARLPEHSLDPILDFLLGEHLRKTLCATITTTAPGCPSAPEMTTNLEDLIWQTYFSGSPVCKAVHKNQTTLGRDHPETIRSLHSLARTLSDKQRWAWALPLYLLCMSREKRTLGDAHPDTLRSMSGLAFAFQNTGRDHDAMEMYEHALKGWGPAVNVYTVRARINMASIYADNELFADAEGVLAETVDEAADALGHRHETTRLAKHNLAFLLRTLGRFEEAKEVYECGGKEHKWVDCPLQRRT